MERHAVYLLTSQHGNVMYVSVTNDPARRVSEHKSGVISGFTKKCNVSKLVYYEHTPSVESAILREKEIKGWRRTKKDALVETVNLEWNDLLTAEGDPSLRSG